MENAKRLLSVRKEGGSRVLTVSSVLPRNWQLVEISVLKVLKSKVVIQIDKVR